MSDQVAYNGTCYRGPYDCIRAIYREQGIRGCFHGLNITILRDIIGFAVYMATYEYLYGRWTPEGKKQPSFSAKFMAGGLAGVISWIVNIQLDVVKTRIQERVGIHSRYTGIRDCIVKTYTGEGSLALWKGVGTQCARAFPVNAITLCVYSTVLEKMK